VAEPLRELGVRTLIAANDLEFEKAALLRDQIKELKRAIDGSGPMKEVQSARMGTYRKTRPGAARRFRQP
jgi:excinuclease UvrABC nuclease subunit